MPSRSFAMPAETSETAAVPSLRRVREALVAAVALACFMAATPAGGAVLAQVQPGEPTADVPLADPARPVAVEIAMRLEGGALVCRPDLARLPPNEELTLQLANLTGRAGAFSAPAFFAAGSVVTILDAEYDHDAAAFLVPAGATAQITLTSGAQGSYAFACAAAGEDASMRGEFVVDQ